MSTATIAPAPRPPSAQARTRRRWTDEEFDRMVEIGLIREGAGTFLWAGEVLDPMAEDNPHNNAVDHLRDLLKSRFPAEAWTVNANFPVDLAEGYRPQPDLAVLRQPRSAYRVRGRRPKPADVVLLVEVSDTTYADDSGPFLQGYAWASIPEYWIVNIHARTIEVYTDPDPGLQAYGSRKDYGLEAGVPLSVLVDGVASEFEAVAVRDVLLDSMEEA